MDGMTVVILGTSAALILIAGALISSRRRPGQSHRSSADGAPVWMAGFVADGGGSDCSASDGGGSGGGGD